MLGLRVPREKGYGIRVAVIDTGIDDSHPDFPICIDHVASGDFTGQSALLPATAPSLKDVQSHGTHIAGIIAGRGKASRKEYAGVASEATLVVLKVSNGRQLSDNAVIAALAHARSANVQIVNYSAGRSLVDANDDPIDGPWVWGPPSPLTKEFAKTAATGILCVAAAGNEGPTEGTVNEPAGLPGVLAVGACDHDKDIYENSSRGPYRYTRLLQSGDLQQARRGRHPLVRKRSKPDLVVPGTDVWAPFTSFYPHPVAALRFDRRSRGAKYVGMYGTSQAAAVASGLAACAFERLRKAGASLGGNEGATMKQLMVEAARLNPCGRPDDAGAGLLRWPQLAEICDRYASSRRYRIMVAARVFWT